MLLSMLENWGEQHSKDGMRAIGRDKKGVIRGELYAVKSDGSQALLEGRIFVDRTSAERWLKSITDLPAAGS
jgi:hypothetical protein